MTTHTSSELPATMAGFDAFANRALKTWGVPGAAVLVVRGDQVLLMKGYGLRDVEANLPMDAETVFPLASVSKAFTAAAVGILVDRGLLDWDRPIKEYVPTFKMYDAFATERLTVRDMLSHRSGLPRHEMMWYGSDFSRREIFERLRFLEPARDLRTTFLYNNLMYASAGYLVELLTGQTWEEFIQKEIFTPLGMNRTTTSYDQMKAQGHATQPYKTEKKKTVLTEFYDRGPKDPTGPAGAVKSCVADLARWVTLQLNGGAAGGVQILSAGSLEQMHTATTPEGKGPFTFRELGETFYGMGWSIGAYRGARFIEHGGNINGITTSVALLPDDKIGVAVLTNLESTFLTMVLVYNIFDRLLGEKPINWNARFLDLHKRFATARRQAKVKSAAERTKGTRFSHPLQAYAGAYQHPGYGPLKVASDGKALRLLYNRQDMPLRHYHYDVFEATMLVFDLTFKVRFDTDVAGKIAGLFLPLESSVKEIYFTRLPDKSLFDPAVLAQYAGLYEVSGMRVRVSLRGQEQLVANAPALGGDLELIPSEAHKFTVRSNPGVRVDFGLDAAGQVERIDVSAMGGTFSGKRLKEETAAA